MTSEWVWALGALGAVVVAAALVNWRAPAQRFRIRRALTLFAIYATALGLAKAIEVTDSVAWKARRISASLE